jgi:hypothetical protein
LLVLDGSPASAGSITLAVTVAECHRSRLTALYVIDGGWKNILGDEWISSEGARRSFFRYMEGDQRRRADMSLEEAVIKCRSRGLEVETLVRTGPPLQVVVSAGRELGPFHLLVLPHPTGRAAEGAVRINAEKAARELACPVLIGPP